MLKKQLSYEEAKELGGKCPKCGTNHLVGTIAKDNESDETVIVDGIELIVFCCHNCNQYFVRTSHEINKVYMLEVRVEDQNPHFQAIFVTKSLADKVKHKYLNDPACKRDLISIGIYAYQVHTDLTVLDSCQPIASNKSTLISATRFDAYECRICETIYDGITAKCSYCDHDEFIIHKKER